MTRSGLDPTYLDSLEAIGWRLGLERMHKLTTALGMPQHRFASGPHRRHQRQVLGARTTSVLLEAHGVGSGAPASRPHGPLVGRTLITLRRSGPEWGDAVEAVAPRRPRGSTAASRRVTR